MKMLTSINKLNEWVGFYFSWLSVVLAIIVAYAVVARYLFNAPPFWEDEIVWMVYAAIWLMGIPYCESKKMHIKVDVLFNRFSSKKRSIIMLIFYIIFFFPFCIIMGIYSIQYALVSWGLREGSTFTIWAPAVYPIKTIMAISFILLCLQGVVVLAENITTLMEGRRI